MIPTKLPPKPVQTTKPPAAPAPAPEPEAAEAKDDEESDEEGPQRKVRAGIYGDTGTMKTGSALTLSKLGDGVVFAIGDEARNNAILDPMRASVIEIPKQKVTSAAAGSPICAVLEKKLNDPEIRKKTWLFIDSGSQLVKLIHDELLGTSDKLTQPQWGTVGHRAVQIFEKIVDGPWPIVIFTFLEDVKPNTIQRKNRDGTIENITVSIEGGPLLHGKVALRDIKPWKLNLIGHMRPPMRGEGNKRISKVNFDMEGGDGFKWLGKDQLGGKLSLETCDWYEIIKKAGHLPPGVK